MLFYILPLVPEADPYNFISAMALIWAQSEVIRFVYYTFRSLQTGLIGTLRYNLFIVLQPIGAITEIVTLIYVYSFVTDQIKNERELPLSFYMPNWYNLEIHFAWVIWVVVALFISGAPVTNSHLWA